MASDTCKRFEDAASAVAKKYSRLGFPSVWTHLIEEIGILSSLYPRFNLQIGPLWEPISDTNSLLPFGIGTLQMKISPVLYPITALLPRGHAQQAEVTFFLSLCADCNTFPPLKIDLLSRTSHNTKMPSSYIISTLYMDNRLLIQLFVDLKIEIYSC